MKEKIERWYNLGLWTAEMVLTAAEKGIITEEQAKAILAE